MRALEAEQHAAAATTPARYGTAHGPAVRSLATPTQHAAAPTVAGCTRLAPWTIACSLLAAGLVACSRSSSRPERVRTAGGHPSRALASGATAPTSGLIAAAMNSFLARGTRRGSQAQPATSPDRSHVPAEAAPSPAGTCPQLNIAGTIALPKHEHSIDDRRIGLDRHDRANQPIELDPALELDALRIKSTTPDEPVAHRTPLELELAPPPNPKRPSVRWSLEPAAAAANSPHASNVHRKVGDT